MKHIDLHYIADGQVELEGELSFFTVENLLANERNIFVNDNITIDLKKITHSDSAGLSLLIEWVRKAKKERKTIHFINIPLQMKQAAVATGIIELLE